MAEEQKNLMEDFNKEMYWLYTEAKSIGYNANRFKIMLDQYGALETARRLLATRNISVGFEELWRLKRLDLTVERLVIEDKFKSLFTSSEQDIAKQRLLDHGYHIP